MIHWQWLLLAVFGSFCFGFFIACILAASGMASRREERMERDIKHRRQSIRIDIERDHWGWVVSVWQPDLHGGWILLTRVMLHSLEEVADILPAVFRERSYLVQ